MFSWPVFANDRSLCCWRQVDNGRGHRVNGLAVAPETLHVPVHGLFDDLPGTHQGDSRLRRYGVPKSEPRCAATVANLESSEIFDRRRVIDFRRGNANQAAFLYPADNNRQTCEEGFIQFRIVFEDEIWVVTLSALLPEREVARITRDFPLGRRLAAIQQELALIVMVNVS